MVEPGKYQGGNLSDQLAKLSHREVELVFRCSIPLWLDEAILATIFPDAQQVSVPGPRGIAAVQKEERGYPVALVFRVGTRCW